jgi:hypothetical protein
MSKSAKIILGKSSQASMQVQRALLLVGWIKALQAIGAPSENLGYVKALGPRTVALLADLVTEDWNLEMAGLRYASK